MHRFFVLQPELKDNYIVLKGDEWRHCQTVLRIRIGERVTLFNGMGTEYLAKVFEIQPKYGKLQVLEKTIASSPPYQITLVQALPKNKVMDSIIQKATELGVREIIPIISDRSVIDLKVEEVNKKLFRWREISIEAAKQCGLNWLPEINSFKSIKEVVRLRVNYQFAFIGSLQPDAQPLWSYLQNFNSGDHNAVVMIGPEGDFTPAELDLAKSAGFQPLSLGSLILRSDTAAIYALSTLSYELRRCKH